MSNGIIVSGESPVNWQLCECSADELVAPLAKWVNETASEVSRDRPATVITSPWYPGRLDRYGASESASDWRSWSTWMSEVVCRTLQSTLGWFIVNASNEVAGGECFPSMELLAVTLHDMGVAMERPLVWHKNSPPNKRPWWVNSYEPIYAFYLRGARPSTWNWQAIAAPPKYKSGGRFRQRTANGTRRLGSEYPQNELARPRDVIWAPVGGGHMGSKLAHENEAPYPESLVEPILLALTNPGDVVIDPFLGSGTTGAVALRHARRFWGCDLRGSQVELALRRITESLQEQLSSK